MQHRQAIELVIGQLNPDGLLGRNYLKGTKWDAIIVALCEADESLPTFLRELRNSCLQILWPVTILRLQDNKRQFQPGSDTSVFESKSTFSGPTV